MLTVKAKVCRGRLVVNEATDLPEGSEIELCAIVDDSDDMDDSQREALHHALGRSAEQLRAGQLYEAEDVLISLDRDGG